MGFRWVDRYTPDATVATTATATTAVTVVATAAAATAVTAATAAVNQEEGWEGAGDWPVLSEYHVVLKEFSISSNNGLA